MADEVLPAVGPRWLDLLERLAKIAAIVAIPVVIPIALAFYSAKVQEGAQKESINRDYVQLAVSILKEKKGEVDPDLRDWSVDLLAEHSPTKFNPAVIRALKSGKVSFPNVFGALTGDLWVLSPNGKLLARVNERRVEVVSVSGGELLATLAGNTSPVSALEFSPDSSILVVGDEGGNVLLYEIKSLRTVLHFGISQPVVSIRYSVPGQIQIASSSAIYVFSDAGVLIRTVSVPAPPTNVRAVQQ